MSLIINRGALRNIRRENTVDRYVAQASDFDGTNDYCLSNDAPPTGIVDGSVGTISVWVRIDGGDGSTRRIFRIGAGAAKFALTVTTANVFQIVFRDPTAALVYVGISASTYTAGTTWRHFLASWDMNQTAGNKICHMYINNADNKGVPTDASAAFSIDYTTAGVAWCVGADTDAATKWNGCISELWMSTTEFMDITDVNIRRKFIDANSKPVDLLKTLARPQFYFRDPAATFGVNSGVSSQFTITGSLDVASTSPSD